MWGLQWIKEWVKMTPSTLPTSLCIKDKHASCLLQRRVMFLRNDYFYTVINETPFRCVLEKEIFWKCDASSKLKNNNVLSFPTVWVSFWLEEMVSTSSLGTSLLRRVRVLSILASLLFSTSVWPLFIIIFSGLHDLLGSDLTIANEWWALRLEMQC